jgi:hypothetical protein
MTGNPKRWLILSLAATGLAVVAFATGVWVRPNGWSRGGALSPVDRMVQLLGQRQLRGSTAATGDSFAMATGPIDSEVEGLYMLDFLTGDLQCVVLNYRTAKFAAMFRANVLNDLGVDPAKKPKYLMTTGAINFPRGATAARPGNSVVYVLETTTGNYAAYGIPWRRELAATGRLQTAALVLLDVGMARTAALRE